MQVLSYLNLLKGAPVACIGNACDMLCVGLGEQVRTNKLGDSLYEFDIHIQAPWRVVNSTTSELLVSSYDANIYLSEGKIMNYGELFEENGIRPVETSVSQISISKYGDLEVAFANGLILSVFSDSLYDECWRIIKRSIPDWHLVFSEKRLFLM